MRRLRQGLVSLGRGSNLTLVALFLGPPSSGQVITQASAPMEEQTARTNEIARNVGEPAKGSSQIAENVVAVATATKSTTQGGQRRSDSFRRAGANGRRTPTAGRAVQIPRGGQHRFARPRRPREKGTQAAKQSGVSKFGARQPNPAGEAEWVWGGSPVSFAASPAI